MKTENERKENLKGIAPVDERVYNPDLGHCAGGRERVCKNCLRRVHFRFWSELPAAERETIILFVPRVQGNDCPNWERTCDEALRKGLTKQGKGVAA